jgi:uncharacterized membrane protein (DUF2068 family)
MASRPAAYPRTLYLIGVFKLFKGLVLFAVGLGALRLFNRNVAAEFYNWANAFRVDPGNYYLRRLLVRISILDKKELKEVAAGTFFYSAIFLNEGVGLLLRKRWAEYFTLIATSTFIPLEVYELVRHPSLAKASVFVLNLAVVAYLALNLRRTRK